MTKKTKILIVIGIAILITAIVLYIRKKKKAAAAAAGNNTITTGGTAPVVNATGGLVVNSGAAGAPVYETGWDGFKVGDIIENISPSAVDIPSMSVGIFSGGSLPLVDGQYLNKISSYTSAVINVPVGTVGKINYIDSGKIQIRKVGTSKTSYQFTRDGFNNGVSGSYTKLSGKLGVKK